jgi:succinyl-diaminopimelate desuccinylase
MTSMVIDTLKELVMTPSHSGDTKDIEELVASKVGGIADVEFLPVRGIGRDVVSRVVHDGPLPAIVIGGHMDTVPVCGGWTRQPLEPTVEGDKLYGLGSSDMKAGLALAIEVFRMLADLGTVNVTFVGTIDEEGDSAGAFAFLEREPEAELCLMTEPTNGGTMMGCRGRLVFEVNVRGRSAHGARPDTGVNAINETSRFVCALNGIESTQHELLGRGSICVLAVEGMTRTLSVPETCRIRLDRHYVPGETPAGIAAQLKGIGAGLESDAEFDIQPDPQRPTPFLEPYVTANEGLAGRFCDAVGAEFMYGRSVGDYNAFAKYMPTVVYGPTGGNWHCADEWVSLSSIEECLRGYRRFLDVLRS